MRLVDLLNTFVTRALWYVAFPYFSEAKGDIDKLRVRVTDCTRYAGLFAFPALAVLAIQSPQLADVFGKEWAAAAPVIRVLCIYGALRSLELLHTRWN